MDAPTVRLSLFPKYALLITTLIVGLLAVSWAISLRISYEESIRHFRLLQNEKANAAASRIGEFLRDIEQHIGLVDMVDVRDERSTMLLRKYELLKLFKQLPQLFEVTWMDASGREQLFLSRANLDRWQSGRDLSALPGVKEALSGKLQFGRPYFQGDSEPHMLFIRPVAGGSAVMADINLKLIWSTVSAISEQRRNIAYVVDGAGTLIAHPDIDLVLRKLSFKALPQVSAAISGTSSDAGRSWSGDSVLSASAAIPSAGWLVFVETPMTVIQGELHQLVQRATLVLIVALVLSVASSYWLARRMIAPIRTLGEGAERIAHGEFTTPIQIYTHDELQHLANQFNQMGSALHRSYAELEEKVASRTLLLEKERARVTELLHSMLPQAIAKELADTGKVLPRQHNTVSILFTDFSHFTQATATMPAERMVEELNTIFGKFDAICEECGIERIKTIGDSYMAVAGVPTQCDDHAHRCVRAGLRMINFLAARNADAAFKWGLRVGIHSGPVVSGIVGIHKYAFDVWGDTVNLASRMESSGEVGRVNISAYTCDLIKTGFRCEYRGKISAKGKGEMDMYFVVGEH